MQIGAFFAVVLDLFFLRRITHATPISPVDAGASRSTGEVSDDRLLRQVADQPQKARTAVAVDSDGSFETVSIHQMQRPIDASMSKSHSSGQQKSERRPHKHDLEVQETLMPKESWESEASTAKLSESLQSSVTPKTTIRSAMPPQKSISGDQTALGVDLKAAALLGKVHGNVLAGLADAAKADGVQLYAKYLLCIAGLILLAVSFFTAYGRLDIPDVVLGWIACSLYLVLALSIDMLIFKAKSSDVTVFSFEPACVVILVEFGKFVTSAGLFGLSRLRPMVSGEPLLSGKFSMNDVTWLSFPAVLFLASNILTFQAIGANDMASFGVFRDTGLLWIAAIWCVVFRVTLTFNRIVALLGIFASLCINQLTPPLSATWSPAILLVCVMALLNACASVAQEFALKRNMALDINLQNSISCIFGMLAGVLYLGVKLPARLGSVQAFFEGFDMLTFMLVGLLLTLGLLVVRVLKYASSVMKSIMQSLRGPLTVLIAPALGFKSRTDTLAYVSAVIVSISAFFFLLQGKPKMDKKNMAK